MDKDTPIGEGSTTLDMWRFRAEKAEQKLTAAQAEIERRNTLCRSLREERDGAQAEIERLKEENERLNTWGSLRRLNDEWTAVEATLKAEIERLRDALEHDRTGIERDQLETKLVNLREASR